MDTRAMQAGGDLKNICVSASLIGIMVVGSALTSLIHIVFHTTRIIPEAAS